MVNPNDFRQYVFSQDKRDFLSGKYLVAIAQINKTRWIAHNTTRSHPKMFKKFKNGEYGACCHAEVNAILKTPRKCRKNIELFVMRFHKRGGISMAKPCELCTNFIRENGIKNVWFTGWTGEWNKMIF